MTDRRLEEKEVVRRGLYLGMIWLLSLDNWLPTKGSQEDLRPEKYLLKWENENNTIRK